MRTLNSRCILVSLRTLPPCRNQNARKKASRESESKDALGFLGIDGFYLVLQWPWRKSRRGPKNARKRCTLRCFMRFISLHLTDHWFSSNKIQESADKYRYCWVFEVGTMRNTHLKTVRSLWKECVEHISLCRDLFLIIPIYYFLLVLLVYSLEDALWWQKH